MTTFVNMTIVVVFFTSKCIIELQEECLVD